MSSGVGPPRDIGIAQEEAKELALINKTALKATLKPPTRGGFFTFRQLNALAVIIVVSASGLVSIEDLAFVIFSIIYMYFISRFAFPAPPPSGEEPSIFPEKNKFLSLYVFIGALIGLFFPILYIFHGILEGDTMGIKAVAPHVFLLGSQVFMEGLASVGGFSLPIQVFVLVFYNSRRIFTVEWLRAEILKAGYGGSSRRVQIGRALAVANMVYWSLNLFGFLLPVFLPKAFKIYYYNRKIRTNIFVCNVPSFISKSPLL